jgi:REP element-mobilizing transposase RayT
LRPDPALNAQNGHWLGRALERSPGITLYAVLAMSNHLHMVLRDERGELPKFMCYYLGNLARSINVLRGRSGPVFHRRYDAARILDPRTAVRYLAYLITNPVRAGLVARHEEWPGVLHFARDLAQKIEYPHLKKAAYRKALRVAEETGRSRPSRTDFEKVASVTVHPLPFEIGESSPSLLGGRALFSLDKGAQAIMNAVPDTPIPSDSTRRRRAFVSASEAAYNEARATERALLAAGRPVLGARRVVAQSPHRAPRRSRISPRARVLCDAGCPALWHAFRRAWRAFNAWYRSAANAFRAGNRLAQYPPHSIRPGGIRAS